MLASVVAYVGGWQRNPAIVVPDSLRQANYKPRHRSPTRAEVVAVLPHLPPDTAAAVAFVLATTAESAALPRALRSHIPEDLDVADLRVAVRGTKNDHRNRLVPIVSDEQRLLLAYAVEHAPGGGERLFGPLANIRRDLELACTGAADSVETPALMAHVRRAAGSSKAAKNPYECSVRGRN